MKRITIEVPEKYSNVLSMTLVGNNLRDGLNVTVTAVDLHKGTYIIIEESGGYTQLKEADKK